MRIAHVTISHPALDVRVFEKECRTLAAAGHEVHLLVPGPVPADRDGVHFHSLGDLDQTTAYFWRVWRRLPEIHRIARRVDAAVYHMPDPALIPLGLALQRRGARVIYDAHEDRPRQARTKYSAIGRPAIGAVTSLAWSVLEAVARRTFDRFVTATPAIARRFPPERTVVVYNYPRLEDVPSPPATPYAERPNHVVYAGTMHRFHGVREAVEAMALMPERLGARLLLIGDFGRAHPGFRAELEALPGWSRVTYLGRLSRDEVQARLGQAKVGITLLGPRPEHPDAIGNKTFEYMAAGLPVVASDYPVWRRVVGDERAGLTVEPQDPARIAAALTHLFDTPAEAEEMGRRGRRAVLERYNWTAEGERLVELYAGLEPAAVPPVRVVGAAARGRTYVATNHRRSVQ
jgi:glycosyltransferase involved in cell wall biosynthesis